MSSIKIIMVNGEIVSPKEYQNFIKKYPHKNTDNLVFTPEENTFIDGLTKREYFAGLAMQGMLGVINALPHDANSQSYIAVLAVQQAEALLAELGKEKV